MAELLLEKEKVRGEDLEAILGARPHKNTFLEDIKALLPDSDGENLDPPPTPPEPSTTVADQRVSHLPPPPNTSR